MTPMELRRYWLSLRGITSDPFPQHEWPDAQTVTFDDEEVSES